MDKPNMTSRIDSSRIVRLVGLLLVVGVVAPFVVTGFPAVVGAEQSFVVMSGSMAAEPAPVIEPGDVILVRDVPAESIAPGDIITYDTGSESPTTHRVVDVQRESGELRFVTKGDNNEDADPQPIGADQLLGRVAITLPLIGHVVLFANTQLGFLTLVGLPIGLLVLSEAWTLVRDETIDRGLDDVTDHGLGVPDGPSDRTDPDDGTVSVGRVQLQYALLVLVPAAIGIGVLAFRLQTAWALTAFYATLGLVVLCGLAFLRLSDVTVPWLDPAPDPLATADTNSRATASHRSHRATGANAVATNGHAAGVASQPDDATPFDPFVNGRIASDLHDSDRLHVETESLDPLVEMAQRWDARVIEDSGEGAYYLVTDQVVYRYDARDAPENSTATEPAVQPAADDEPAQAMNDGGRPEPASDVSERTSSASTGSDDDQSGDSRRRDAE